jgi:MFS family permease
MTAPAPPATAVAPYHHLRWTVAIVVLCANTMDLLDATIVNVASPTIHDDLGTSSTALQWIIGGYPLAIAVGLIRASASSARSSRPTSFPRRSASSAR